MAVSQIGLVGLAVMGQVSTGLSEPTDSRPMMIWHSDRNASSCPQNMALNVAEKGFPISVFNRSYEKTEAAVTRAKKEGGFH
jgi:6-phosphogluconate dehydrogenase